MSCGLSFSATIRVVKVRSRNLRALTRQWQVLRVKYPAWVKSAVDLKDVSSFGGTPTRGAGELGMGQVITPTQAQTRPVVGWEAEKVRPAWPVSLTGTAHCNDNAWH